MMKHINQPLGMSRRDNMLVEKEISVTSYRPVRNGMWVSRHLEMSRMGLNMYNPLQAKRSWGYKITSTLSELRSSSICYHDNHSNHSSDKRGRKGEGTKGRKVQATNISSWLTCLLLVACCLLPYNKVIKSNL
jgi:hypothetical protein